MNVTLLDQEGNAIDMDALAKEAEKEERRINSNIRNLIGDGSSGDSVVDEEAVGMSSRSADDVFGEQEDKRLCLMLKDQQRLKSVQPPQTPSVAGAMVKF